MTRLGPTLDPEIRRRTERNVARFRTRDNLNAFEKLTTVVNGEPRIVSDPPLIVPIEELFPGDEYHRLMGRLHTIVRGYRRTLQSDRRQLLESFQLVQVARKVVGVGSVGTRAWILLLLGRDDNDPLILQAKEAEASVLERFVGVSEYANNGQRVVAGQHVMQASSDIFLGWERVEGVDGKRRDFYVRQLRDWKGSADIDTMNPARSWPPTASYAAGPWHAPMPARATASPSTPTWAKMTSSTRPSPGSRNRTPTRTSGTTTT